MIHLKIVEFEAEAKAEAKAEAEAEAEVEVEAKVEVEAEGRGLLGMGPVGLLLLVLGLGFVFLGAPAAEAQFVRFNLNTGVQSFNVKADPLDFRDTQRSKQLLDNAGRVTGLQSGSCMELSAPENINVLVRVSIEDEVDLQGRERPLQLQPGYINDMGACPGDFRLAADISKPFRADGSAHFALSEKPVLIRSLGQGNDIRRISAFVYLLGSLTFNPDAGITVRLQDQLYRGRFIVDIEYL